MEIKWIPFLLLLCAFTPIYTEHDDQRKTDQEFINVANDVQSRQFKVVNSTPNLLDLRDNELVIMSSGTITRIMFRTGQEVYSLNVSCVTVRR